MGKSHLQLNIGADQADRWRKNARKKRRRSRWRPQYLFALVMVPVAAFFTMNPGSLDVLAKFIPAERIESVPDPSSLLSGGCTIKGNISIDSGEHIYHVPGQRYYSQTIIRPEYGERWFCSEDEARAAGWRRARR